MAESIQIKITHLWNYEWIFRYNQECITSSQEVAARGLLNWSI